MRYNPRPMAAASLDRDLSALIAVAFVAGSIPFGLLVGLAKGVDVRTAGSQNIGASNVGRLLGRRYFFLVFLLDGSKGLVPVVVASALVRQSGVVPGPGVYGLWMGIALAGILGHVYSVFLRFKGGKGVATTAGVLLGFWPYCTWPAVVMMAVFAVVFRTTGYISVGSMAAASAFPVSYLAFALSLGWGPFGPQWPLTAFSFAVPALVIYKHRSNLARLRAGTENRTDRFRRG